MLGVKVKAEYELHFKEQNCRKTTSESSVPFPTTATISSSRHQWKKETREILSHPVLANNFKDYESLYQVELFFQRFNRFLHVSVSTTFVLQQRPIRRFPAILIVTASCFLAPIWSPLRTAKTAVAFHH